MTTDLAAYYAARASEYERVYDKPERQADLARLRVIVSDYFKNSHALEIACGTGYWTAYIAAAAQSVVATDLGDEVLEIAKAKAWPAEGSISFRRADAFDLAGITGDFDAGFAGFWWSHVRHEDLGSFLDGFHARLQPNARVMVLDNRYVEGSSSPISRLDSTANTYQRRMLSNGETHEVLKNFPTPTQVHGQLGARRAQSVEVVELPYYWYATYRSATA